MNIRYRKLALIMACILLLDCNIEYRYVSAEPVNYGINNPRTAADGTVTWDKIKFGNYEQTAKFTPEPVKWRILSVNDDKTDALVMADKALDCKAYNDVYTAVTWKECTLRTWLNSEFLNNAFETEEQVIIKDTVVSNPDNSKYGTEGGEDTTDKIYLLSEDEACNAEYGFEEKSISGNTRKIDTTDYGKINGVQPDIHQREALRCKWWLRSAGENENEAVYVNNYGNITLFGDGVSIMKNAVCPVMHIDLTSELVSDAGEVYSDGRITNMEDGYYPPEINNGVTMWDCVYFGHYRQNASYDAESIEWRVLSVDGDDALLLADNSLDCVPFNDKWYSNITWENSTLRNWLNNTFKTKAFSDEEKEAIRNTSLGSEAASGSGNGGEDTNDMIFLLALEDVERTSYGFTDEYTVASDKRTAEVTDYAYIRGNKDTSFDYGSWWLRSPCDSNGKASIIWNDGKTYSSDVDNRYCYVRPALHIDVSKSVWSYSGTVNSKGEVTLSGADVSPEPYPEVTPTAVPDDIPDIDKIDNPRKDEDGNITWDKIRLGMYEQSAIYEPERIKWKILYARRDGKDALVIADKALDSFPYNDTYESITWKDCTLRKWLNEDFLYKAFTEAERAVIKETNVVNEDNEQYGVDGGDDTTDKLYLLSENEANNNEYGYYNQNGTYSKDRYVKASDYTRIKGVFCYPGSDYCRYWLRTPGSQNGYASYISTSGSCSATGKVSDDRVGVCPVMHIDLTSELVEDAGEVDSKGNITMLNNGYHSPRRDDNTTTWDCVYLGRYNQSAEYRKEPVEWKVLLRREYDAFVISDKALDCKPYNETQTNVTWETCSLRDWLNDDFYNSVFTAEEQAIIKETEVVNKKTTNNGGDAGNNTTDKLYLLSYEEANNERYGFTDKISNRLKAATDYAKNKGVEFSQSTSNRGCCMWWLRSVGATNKNAMNVENDGRLVYYYGNLVDDKTTAVSPVMHINLASYAWKYAGTVNTTYITEQYSAASPEPNPTVMPSSTTSPTETPSPSPTPSSTVTPSSSPSQGPIPIVTPSPSPSTTEKPSLAPSPTGKPSPSPTMGPTVTPSPSPALTGKPGTTPGPLVTSSPGPTKTSSPASTETPSPPPASTLTPSPDTTPVVTPAGSPATGNGHRINSNVVTINGDTDIGNVNNTYTYNINNYNNTNTNNTDISNGKNNKKQIKYKNNLYRVIGNKKVTYISPVGKKVKNIKIPSVIWYKGLKYKVTRIDKKACYRLKKLKTVLIGKNVTVVGKKAFSGCSNLNAIIFGKGVKKLEDEVLAGDKKLKTIKYTGTRITSFGRHTFRSVSKKTDIIIPKKVQEKYVKLIRKAR